MKFAAPTATPWPGPCARSDFPRSGLRTHWHVFNAVRDYSSDAFTPPLGFACWVISVIVLVFLLLIARFYQRFAMERTFFEWFAVPILLFGAALMRYASIGHLAGDLAGDALFGLAGLSLLGLSVFLYYRMTQNR